MNNGTKVSRAVHDLVEHAKNTVAQNIAQAASRGDVKGLTGESDLTSIIALVKQSIDQAYHQMSKTIDKTVASALAQESSSASAEVAKKNQF